MTQLFVCSGPLNNSSPANDTSILQKPAPKPTWGSIDHGRPHGNLFQVLAYSARVIDGEIMLGDPHSSDGVLDAWDGTWVSDTHIPVSAIVC